MRVRLLQPHPLALGLQCTLDTTRSRRSRHLHRGAVTTTQVTTHQNSSP